MFLYDFRYGFMSSGSAADLLRIVPDRTFEAVNKSEATLSVARKFSSKMI